MKALYVLAELLTLPALFVAAYLVVIFLAAATDTLP